MILAIMAFPFQCEDATVALVVNCHLTWCLPLTAWKQSLSQAVLLNKSCWAKVANDNLLQQFGLESTSPCFCCGWIMEMQQSYCVVICSAKSACCLVQQVAEHSGVGNLWQLLWCAC